MILYGKIALSVFSQVSLSFSSLMKSSRTAKMMNREKQVHFVLKIACLSGGVVHQFAVVEILSTHLLSCQNHFKQFE